MTAMTNADVAASADFGFTIDLPVTSEWDNNRLGRSSVEMCLSTLFGDIDSQHTLAMVTGELLENAVKYGHWTLGTGVFRLRIWGVRGAEAIVEVSNPIESAAAAAAVIEAIGRVNDSASPADAYRARVLEIATSGACKLAARSSADVVTVTARLNLC
jgi:hypothetical protein